MFDLPPDLAARMGEDLARKRLLREQRVWKYKRGGSFRVMWGARVIPWIIRTGLRVTGLSRRTHREFLDVQIVENVVALPSLPVEFDGFRLLQISDLHSDLDPALIDRVIERLGEARFDQAVLTGDYHDEIGVPWDESLALTLRLMPHLGTKPLAILGNHDFLAKVEPFEAAGLRVLLNESIALERNGMWIWICGVDDPHIYGTHDLHAAMAGIPGDGCRILLSHSPETAREASELGYALHLSGHTHGGQICLPGGFPIVRKAPVRRALLAGPWHEGAMAGYTSRGTGSCTVAARFHCPPEITVHILRCA